MRPIKALTILILITIVLAFQGSAAFAGSTRLFNDEYGNFFNYAPSYIQTSSTERYIYYCKNRYSGYVKDYIYYRKATLSGSTWTWGPQRIALAPSYSGWDSSHVCDPDVKQGSFLHNGHTYSYAMLYLGTNRWDNNGNQIGIAFADTPNGPWVKYAKNPLIAYPGTTTWGIGQPSAISATSVDGAGRLLLFYTKGSSDTNLFRRDVNISNMSSPWLGAETQVFSDGLTNKTPNSFCFHNAAFAYDGATDRIYVIRDRGLEETVTPNFVSSEVQVAYTSGGNVWSNTGTWTVEGSITPDQSGHTRNHNSSLLTDSWGNLTGGANGYQIAFTASDTGTDYLWQYRIFSAPKSDLTNINKIDGQNKGVTYSGEWHDYFDSGLQTWYMATNKWTSSQGAYFQAAFTGTNIHYYGSKASDNGKADIYVDGVFQATIDTYSPTFLKSVLLWSKTGLAAGNHTIKVVVRGDKNPSSTGYNKDLDYLKVEAGAVHDTEPPVATYTGPAGTVEDTSPTVTGAATDNVGVTSVKLSLNGGAATDCSIDGSGNVSCLTSDLAYGDYSALITAYDAADNWGTASGSFTIQAPPEDTEKPVVTYVGPTGTIGDPNPTITGTATDKVGVTAIAMSLNGGAATTCSIDGDKFSCPASGLEEGDYTAVITASDAANNVGSDRGLFTVAFASPDMFQAKWDELNGAPGEPTSDVYNVPGGQARDYAYGRLIYNEAAGKVYWIYGAILAKYDAIGGPESFLGLPTSDPYSYGNGKRSAFEGGYIYSTQYFTIAIRNR